MHALVSRPGLRKTIEAGLRRSPVVVLLGPRQCGKTTLAREIATRPRASWFDLEDPATPLRPETARQVLAPLDGLVVIDEFQRQPGLFELLRVLADRRPTRARFLLLGSASPELARGAAETLAGRVAFCEMSGFDVCEVGARHQSSLWLRGGFPRSFLARSDSLSLAWRMDFVQSFLERDLPQLGLRVPAPTVRRFWMMLAHFHGQVWNAAELARSMGAGENAVRHYLDVLSGAFMVRQLMPWFENVGKRLVRSPKVYFRDSGLLHALLGLGTRLQALSNPRLGASWEGFALEQILRLTGGERDCFFYATHGGAELDLLLMRGGRRYGFELKHDDAPRMTKSMHVAFADLGLERLFVVHPGEATHPLGDKTMAVGLATLETTLREAHLLTRRPGR
jgi:predicted AAA+ superfamily ATPase